MADIYRYSDEFEESVIIAKLNEIADELDEERSKPLDEYSKERELKLINKQLMEGMKLSTRFGTLWR